MKHTALILMGGLLLAFAAYQALYHAGTAATARMAGGPSPELAWLKDEFHLSDADFERVAKMHESYLAGCMERCQRIDETNAVLVRQLGATNRLTPEIQATLAEVSRMRTECQKKMLEQFYEISRGMPPEQGKRYLAWAIAQTLPGNAHSQMHPCCRPASHE